MICNLITTGLNKEVDMVYNDIVSQDTYMCWSQFLDCIWVESSQLEG